MELSVIHTDLKKQATKLPNKYEDYDIDFLANSYCDAKDNKDKKNQDIFISALILRFWYRIERIYKRVRNLGYSREDIFEKLYECVEIACYYRAWQNPAKHTNAQSCINQTIMSRGLNALLIEANRKKNYHEQVSLHEKLENGKGTTFADIQIDHKSKIDMSAQFIIQSMIEQNRIVEAIIADVIANEDTFRHTSKTIKTKDQFGKMQKYTQNYYEFWPFQAVQTINELSKDYNNYFTSTYKVKPEKFDVAIQALLKAPNQKKYKMIHNSLEFMKSFV